jgi:hypothetical protein
MIYVFKGTIKITPFFHALFKRVDDFGLSSLQIYVNEDIISKD